MISKIPRNNSHPPSFSHIDKVPIASHAPGNNLSSVYERNNDETNAILSHSVAGNCHAMKAILDTKTKSVVISGRENPLKVSLS